MSNKVECSVVMTLYNAEKYIKQAIDSVLNQTMKNFELIIVNDCSTDGSEEIVKTYTDERIKYFKNKQNSKVSFSRNFGVSQASGDYVAFIDSDDVWLNTKLERQLEYMKSKNAKICYSSYGFVDDDGVLQDKIFDVPKEVNYKRLLKQNVITPSASIFAKELLIKYPFYADKIHEDFLAFLSMLKGENITAVGINDPLILYRLTVNSKSRNKLKAMKMTLQTYKEFGLNIFQRLFYLMFYIKNGLCKYKGIKDAKNEGYKSLTEKKI